MQENKLQNQHPPAFLCEVRLLLILAINLVETCLEKLQIQTSDSFLSKKKKIISDYSSDFEMLSFCLRVVLEKFQNFSAFAILKESEQYIRKTNRLSNRTVRFLVTRISFRRQIISCISTSEKSSHIRHEWEMTEQISTPRCNSRQMFNANTPRGEDRTVAVHLVLKVNFLLIYIFLFGFAVEHQPTNPLY